MSRKSFTFFFLLLAVLLAALAAGEALAQVKPQVKRPVAKPAPRATPTPGPDKPLLPAMPLTPEQEKRLAAFNTVWKTIKDNYFDQTFSGLNWEAIRKEYEPLALKATTSLAFHSVLQDMINRLNRSHFVILPPEVYRELEKAKAQVKQNEIGADGDANDGEDTGGEKEAGGIFFDDADSKFGIGIEIRVINSQVVITEVEKGSSAARGGLKPGYVIDKVNGVSLKSLLQTFIFSGSYGRLAEKMFPLEVIEYFINGEKESSVLISYLDEKDAPKEASIKRERLNGKLIKAVPNFPREFFSFESRALSEDIGYIKFNMFAMAAVEGVCRALTEFKDKKTVIIDMRGNIGGSIGALIGITGMLIDKPTMLGTQIYRTSRESVAVLPQGRKYNGKLIVLIDSLSYSAAEIFAGGLQESGRLTVVGEKSAGQALPSTTIQLATGALFMYPFANFQTPKGYSIEGKGVEPDVNIPRERKSLLEGKDAQLDAAVALSGIKIADKPAPIKIDAKIEGKLDGKMEMPPVPVLKPRPNGSFKIAEPAPAPKSAPKYDEAALKVIRDFISVSGGEEAVKNLSAYTAKGTLEINRAGASISGKVEMFYRSPDKSSEIMTVDSVGDIRSIFDGKNYYVQSDIMGNSESGEPRQIREIGLLSDLQEMIKIKQLYRQVIYLGEFPHKGKTAILVKAVADNGVEIAFAFDQKTKFLLHRVGTYTDISYDDYRKVGGLMLPFWQTRSDAVIMKLSEFKLNVPLEDSVFVPKDNCFTVKDHSDKEEK